MGPLKFTQVILHYQKKIAVKIIDDRGIESMKVLKVGENDG